MALRQLNSYSLVGNDDLDALMETEDKNFKGKCAASLTEYDTTAKPKLAAGSVIEVNGALFIADDDEDPSGSPADGTVYLKIVPSGSTATVELTATAPAWDNEKQGWYSPTAGEENHRYVPFGMTKNGTLYITKYSFTRDYAKTGIFHAVDEKPSGTNGGAFYHGAWRTRDLNTIRTNDIGAVLGSNQVTLPPGKYEVFAHAPAFDVYSHKAILYDITNSAVLLVGTTEHTGGTDNVAVMTKSDISGVLILEAFTTIEIRHRCYEQNITHGFGFASSFGVVEIYSEILIKKIT